MATSKEDIRRWLQNGIDGGSTHVVVMVDTYDWEDYPVYCQSREEAAAQVKKSGQNMQQVMEVYNLGMDLDAQLGEHRSYNL